MRGHGRTHRAAPRTRGGTRPRRGLWLPNLRCTGQGSGKRRAPMQLSSINPEVARTGRAHEIWSERMDDLRRSTDRMFAILMFVQWLAGIVMALVVSPQTWIGATGSIHPHVLAAVVLGG